MKFKKGKRYKVTKQWNPKCIKCVLKYKGINKNGDHYGFPIPLICRANGIWDNNWTNGCNVFQGMIKWPDKYKLVEKISMVKFCKKLRKELRS